jgi:hypothetical protein
VTVFTGAVTTAAGVELVGFLTGVAVLAGVDVATARVKVCIIKPSSLICAVRVEIEL